MEEVISALRAANTPVPVPLELPNEEDILEAEGLLFLSLDRDFRDFLLTASDIIIGALEPVTVADPNSHTYLPDVAANVWEHGLPRHLIPLCEIADGCYATDPGGQVVLWQEGDITDQSWETVWQWAYDVWLSSSL